MRIGFLIPTALEARNIPDLNRHVTCSGYGAGKVAACSAAADLIFNKHCDTIVIWGLGGALSHRVDVNDVVVASHVAYRDFNIYPLCGSTGVGWVENFAEDLFVELDPGLRSSLAAALHRLFPGRRVLEGKVCSGEQFVEFHPGDTLNRVEAASDVVDMESAAVVHFCHNIAKSVKVGVVRVISDNADHNANVDFNAFLGEFAGMNGSLYRLREELMAADPAGENRIMAAIRDYPDFPVKGVLFKDIWGIVCDREVFDAVCNRMYDLFFLRNQGARITKIAGVESRGFIFGFEMAKMFGVPFVPLRKKGKLPGKVVSDTYRTEYSESTLEGQTALFRPGENVLLVDDIIATGGSLLAARNVVEKCGAECRHCLALGQIGGLNGADFIRSQGLTADYLFEL